ncbi:MAG: hypothetical protein U0002_01720 [Thermoanaerobaculia bacterium]
MGRIGFWLILLGTLLLALPVAAQTGAPGEAHPCLPGMPNYELATEVRLSGTVVQLLELTSPLGSKGLHFLFRPLDGSPAIEVHVAPLRYVRQEGFVFSVGDALEVLGSRVRCDRNLAILAREIKRGTSTLVLRDEKGFPLWGSPRRHS